MNIHRQPYIQAGSGFFGSFLKAVLPIGKTIFKSLLNSDVTKNVKRAAGQSLKNSALSIASDIIKGGNVKTTLGKNFKSFRDDIGNSLQEEPPDPPKQKRVQSRAKVTRRKHPKASLTRGRKKPRLAYADVFG
jgi:hypothetical protein